MTAEADRIRQLYDTTLRPRIDALEGLRLNVRSLIARAGTLIGVPLAGIVFGEAFDFLIPGYGFVIPWASFALLLVALVVAFRCYFLPTFTGFANYKARFKKEVVSEIFRIVCPTATYEPFESIPETIFDEPGIFHAGGYCSDDRVRGRIDQTPFEAAEVRRAYSTGTGKSARTHTVFRGLFFHIDFNKVLAGTTIVQPQAAGGFQVADRSALSPVTVDHPAFAREFAVFASDPREARDLLTASMMERLLALRQRAGHPVFLGLKNNRLYLGIHYDRALFEPGIVSTTSLESIQEMAANFALSELLVRELELNTRIWAKPVDAALLERPAAREAMLAEELMTGTLTPDEAWSKVTKLAGIAPENETETVQRPADTRIDVQHDGAGAVISYGLPVSFFITLAVSAACVFASVCALRALSTTVDLGPLATILAQAPSVEQIDTLVADHPLPWFAGTAVLASFLSLWWITRVRRVAIGRDAVHISRGLRPWPRRYPRPPYGRVVRLDRAVYIGKDGSTGLINPSASPMLQSEDEARWVAAEMRRAMQ